VIAGLAAGSTARAADATLSPIMAYRAELSAALQKSEVPRDRALGAQLLESVPASGAHLPDRGAILQGAAKAAPADRLVLRLWAALPVAGMRCRPHRICIDHAHALARLEPDNGAAWVPVVAAAWKRHDGRGADAALLSMADTRRYNEHLGEALGAWRDVLRRFPPSPRSGLLEANADPAADNSLLDLVFAEAVATAIPSADPLVDVCGKARHPEASMARFRACGRVARVMMGRSQTLIGRLSGVRILRASQTGTKADIDPVRTVTWQFEQYEKVVPVLAANASAKLNHMNMIESTDSEMRVVHFELASAGVALTPPPDWKQTIGGKTVEPLEDVEGVP
jgi:hypothetical protein